MPGIKISKVDGLLAAELDKHLPQVRMLLPSSRVCMKRSTGWSFYFKALACHRRPTSSSRRPTTQVQNMSMYVYIMLPR